MSWQKKVNSLSHYQAKVYRCAVDGLSNAEIAAKLNIGISGVTFHLKAIFEIFGVESRARLIASHYKSMIASSEMQIGG